MKLIVGLGNPGKEYEKTRHNVGFEVVEELARQWGISLAKKKFETIFGEARVREERVLLALPQTYMNLSGQAVSALVGFFKVDLTDCVVIHDDLDLPVGRIKVVRGGGPAGHRGVASIQELLGTENFCRFRIGVGKPAQKEEVVDFVLKPFLKEEKKPLQEAVEKAKEGLEIWIEKGVEAAIAFCHKK